MGLFSTIRNVGLFGRKASSLAGRFGKKISNVPFLGRASKIVLGGSKFARFVPPVTLALGAIGVGRFLTKITKGTPFQSIARKNSERRATRKDDKVRQTAEIAQKGGFFRGVKKVLGFGALIAGTAFLAEQLAEKAGIRGGAGFIGKRKPKAKPKRKPKRKPTGRKRVGRKRVGRKRRTHRSPRHKGHKRVSFTTKDGKKVNFLVRKKGGVSHRKRRRKKR